MEKPLTLKNSCFWIRIKKHPLLLAFAFNIFAFAFRLIVFEVKYEVSDDYITDAVLSGAFGNGYDPNLLFGNIILGYLLVILYKLIPVVSFYFVLLLLLGFASVTTIVFLLFKKNISIVSVCMAIVFVSVYTDDLYVLIQFTKVATAAGIAGGLLILYSIWEADKNQYSYLVSGLVLMILGIMVRFSTIYIFAAFLVVSFVVICIRYIKHASRLSLDGSKNNTRNVCIHIIMRFMICVMIISLMFVIQSLGVWISNLDKGHKEFNEYHDLRYSITDTTTPEYKDVETEYKELGLDSLDFVMLNSWSFDDRGVYSDDILQAVAEIHKRAKDSNPVSINDAIVQLSERRVFTYPAAVAVYILAMFVFVLERKHYYSIILMLVSLAFLIGFVIGGRTVYRVEWSVLFCAASSLITCFDYQDDNLFSKLKAKVMRKNVRLVSVFVIVITIELMLVRLPRLYMSNEYKHASEEEYYKYFVESMLHSGEYYPEKLSCPTITRNPCPNLINYMKNDTEHFYYIDFGTGIQTLYFNYNPWIRPEQGLFCDDYAYFGSCTMSHPGERYALEYNGCDPDNPFKSLVNDNILLVDLWGYDYKLEYIIRYYYPDAKIELYDIVDGYPIWNIYIP